MSRRLRSELGAALAVVGIAAASCVARWPGFAQGRFASHDVGGILYNAMLLRAGGLPYVDSIEVKAPGAFYLAAALAGPEGRDIAAFQVAANALAVLSLLLVAALARRLWGPAAAVVAAAVYALHDAHLDSMDANYVTWAQAPQIAAMLAAAAAAAARARAVSRARALGTWLVSGALCGAAALCKQPAGIVLVPALAWALRGPGRVDARAAAAVLAGFALAHAPVALHYLARGHLADLVTGYAWNHWGLAYLTRRLSLPWYAAAWEWIAASAHFLALPLALAGFALAARPRTSPAPTDMPARTGPLGQAPRDMPPQTAPPGAVTALVVWALAALLAAAAGLRFFKGYFLAALPPLCLLAAAPWGLGAAAPWRRWTTRLIAAPLVLVLAARAALVLHATRVDRALPHDEGARKIGEFIARHSAPDDRIWVWGWHLWGVHAYSGRLSASRVYKTLGLITLTEDDTWRAPGSPLVFSPESPYTAMLLADLAASPPAFVALGGTAPHQQFTALRELLRERYVRDLRLRVGKVELWRRRDLPGAPAP